MNFKPLGLRVLVEREVESTTTTSGIIIPDSAKEKPALGDIVAVSKDMEHKLSLNDKVVFGQYAGTELVLNGKEYLVLNHDDILGIIG
jgi:chaperonin GroES